MTKRQLGISPFSREQLPDMPIEAAWILEGNPIARGKVLLQSDDKRFSTGLWECSEGKFQWIFGWDEFVSIMEGEVTIRQENGPTVTLKAGDTAFFPEGLQTEWNVTKKIRKTFTVRTQEPLDLSN